MRSGRVRSGRVTEVRLERNRRPRGFGRDTHRCDGFDGFSLLLVEVGDVALLGLLHDDLNGGGDRCGVRFDTTSGCASRKINQIDRWRRRQVGGIFKFDAPGSYPDTWCGCAQPRPDACLRRGRRETGVQRMLGSIRSPRKANQRVGRDGRSGGVRLGRRSPLARLDGPTPGRNPRAEREGSGTRGVRDGREGSMTGGCRVVSVSDPWAPGGDVRAPRPAGEPRGRFVASSGPRPI